MDLFDAINDLHDRFAAVASEAAVLSYQLDDLEYAHEDAAEPTFHRSPERPPRMTAFCWRKDQGVELGATSRRTWYWRISLGRGNGSMWAGPYYDVGECKQAALEADYQQWKQRKAEAA